MVCWLEILLFYDFEIIYRVGKFYFNVDFFFWYFCFSLNCKYCYKLEIKESLYVDLKN